MVTVTAPAGPISSATEEQHRNQTEPRHQRSAVLKNIKDLECPPPHPGEILRDDMLPRLHLAPAGLAGKLGLPAEAVAELLAERRPVTSEIAARLAATFGHSARFWLGLQTQHDRWLAFGAVATQPA